MSFFGKPFKCRSLNCSRVVKYAKNNLLRTVKTINHENASVLSDDGLGALFKYRHKKKKKNFLTEETATFPEIKLPLANPTSKTPVT